MKLNEKSLVEALSTEALCLGAVFCTYNFDPTYFEEHVLRSALALREDPDEARLAFLEEARGALQRAPVAVLVDAGMRQAGKRLPYDQLLVRSRTFHPKLALVLHEESARLLIGSCNLTRPGFEENVEFAFVRDLRFDEDADAATLHEVAVFLNDCAALAEHRGTQLDLVLDALKRRLPVIDAGKIARDHRLLSTVNKPLLDQLFESIPADATITQIGVLAPYFETDDIAIASDEGAQSVLRELIARRASKDVLVDLGVAWVDAPIAPTPGTPAPTIEATFGRLCAWQWTKREPDSLREVVEYLTPTSVGATMLSYLDSHGAGRRWEFEDAEEALAENRFWVVAPPTIPLPKTIVEHLSAAYEVGLWLHPSTKLEDSGRPRRRNLHAKLFAIATKRKGVELTYILSGSPNASRMAMLRDVQGGGNVELGVLAVVQGRVTLPDLLPDLVLRSHSDVVCTTPEFPALNSDLSVWIEDVVFDAREGTLTVCWATDAKPPLGDWKLRYGIDVIAEGQGAPQVDSVISPFVLRADLAELSFDASERTWPIPIRVADLAALSPGASIPSLDLRDLLALLGKRMGVERLTTLARDRGLAGKSSALEAIFGEGFGPNDVFKAWWGVAYDLAQPTSLASFRLRLHGALGAQTAWSKMRELADVELGRDEAWFYGAELRRTLLTVALPEDGDREAKKEELACFCQGLTTDLKALAPSATGRPWLSDVLSFYEPEQTHD